MIHHRNEYHQSLFAYVDNRSVHLVAYNLVHKKLEPLYRAPNYIVHFRIVDYRNLNIVVVENQLHHPDNPIWIANKNCMRILTIKYLKVNERNASNLPEYYMRNIFYFPPDI